MTEQTTVTLAQLQAELEILKEKEAVRKSKRAAIMRRYTANNTEKMREIKRKFYHKRKQEKAKERLEAESLSA